MFPKAASCPFVVSRPPSPRPDSRGLLSPRAGQVCWPSSCSGPDRAFHARGVPKAPAQGLCGLRAGRLCRSLRSEHVSWSSLLPTLGEGAEGGAGSPAGSSRLLFCCSTERPLCPPRRRAGVCSAALDVRPRWDRVRARLQAAERLGLSR